MDEAVIKEIKYISATIDDNLSCQSENKGLLSQNILSQLRTLIEDVIVLEYNKRNKASLSESFDDKKKAYKQLNNRRMPKLLYELHTSLQVSKSHYAVSYNSSERLMQKYYYYLIQLKQYLKNEFQISILNNIHAYPLDEDDSFEKFYKVIIHEIDRVQLRKKDKFPLGRYYVEKKKLLYYNNRIYYEYTLTNANDNNNKFDRIIVFSKLNVHHHYAIEFTFVERQVKLFSVLQNVMIMDGWRVSIRPCELDKLSKMVGHDVSIKSSMYEYMYMMDYLTNSDLDLLDLALIGEPEFERELLNVKRANTTHIYEMLKKSRSIIQNNCNGSNILRYMLFTARNTVLKKSISFEIPNPYLSNLFVKKECYPFEKLPFVMSLPEHNPEFSTLLKCIDPTNKEGQFIARKLRQNVTQNGILYSDIADFDKDPNFSGYIESFNGQLYGKQKELTIKKDNNFVYLEGYEKSTIDIIQKISELSTQGIRGYSEAFDNWAEDAQVLSRISEDKVEILRRLYSHSRVALIYGAAGTGKTTLISHVSNFLADKDKIFLTCTNTALDHLKRTNASNNSRYYTIAKYLKKDNSIRKTCDILIVDECSTVSNKDINNIINNSDFKLLLLVGDVCQIEAIEYGNWFSYAKNISPKHVVNELKETHRTNDEHLLHLWEIVRNNKGTILEYIERCGFSHELDQSLLEKNESDEIVLCLGYDGLYGINQINRYLQIANNNKEFEYGMKKYRIGDPILFNDVKPFSPVLYNNLKGTIIDISENDSSICFYLRIEKVLTELDIINTPIKLIDTIKNASTISITLDKDLAHDDDDDAHKCSTVPFNISYAISIHKAQGLEYNSVKLVLTQDIEEMVTKNVFYTAITRSKKKLSIYWTKETERRITQNLKDNFNAKDYGIFKQKHRYLGIL